MRKVKIVADSSANLLKLERVAFASAPSENHHCRNEQAAQKLKNLIREAIPGAAVTIGENRGLCSYYAEVGGLLIGYEKM